jgi:hypothetical protein
MAFVLARPNTNSGGFHRPQVLTAAVVLLVMVFPYEIYDYKDTPTEKRACWREIKPLWAAGKQMSDWVSLVY